jgi:hypothetical protein
MAGEPLDINQFINFSTPDVKFVKVETFDSNALSALLRHSGVSEDDKKKLKKYNKMRFNGNQVRVVYDLKEDFKKIGAGECTENFTMTKQLDFKHSIMTSAELLLKSITTIWTL